MQLDASRGGRLIVLSLFASLACVGSLSAQSVWSGLTYEFNRPDFAFPRPQDAITPSVSLTRNDTQGLYNAFLDSGWNGSGPTGTQWATAITNPGKAITAANWAELQFGTWLAAYGGSGALGSEIVGKNAVIHLIDEEIYLDLRFTSWTQHGGGGFTYLRAAPPPPTGDYNGDRIVNAADYTVWRNSLGEQVAFYGAGADGDADGMVDFEDYFFWKDHYGEMAGDAGQSFTSDVPEPSALMLATASIMLLLCVAPRPYGGRRNG
jgi:hypothetical protein